MSLSTDAAGTDGVCEASEVTVSSLGTGDGPRRPVPVELLIRLKEPSDDGFQDVEKRSIFVGCHPIRNLRSCASARKVNDTGEASWMFILRGSLADVRRYICSKLRHALQCKMFATSCAMRYSAKILRGGWGSG